MSAPKEFYDLTDKDGKPKVAPVQGYGPGIPWSMHLEAYEVYCKRYGTQGALIDLAGRSCRGGFATGELDIFIPGWREKLSERTKLVSEISRLHARVAELELALTEQARDAVRDQLVAAVKASKAAHESLFEQCLSNPITNAWGKQIDMTALNKSRMLADAALSAAGVTTDASMQTTTPNTGDKE